MVQRKSLVGGIGADISKGVRSIIKQSSKAVCGTFEREIVVPSSKVAATKAQLRKAGKMIIGTSEPGRSTRIIWFVDRGLASL